MLNLRNPSMRDVGRDGSSLVVFEDEQVDVGRVRLGANAPTWRTYDYGIGGGVVYDTLGFGVNDYISFQIQTKHAMKLNSVLDCHLHLILPNTTDIGDKFQFRLDVVAAGVDVAYAVPSGSPFTAEHTIIAGDNTKNTVLDLADIPAINSTVSTIYKVRLTRIAASADEYGSEVYLDYVDCHFQRDTLGSREEYTK